MGYTCKQIKDYIPSLRNLYNKGGLFSKAVEKANHITQSFENEITDIKNFNRTNYGENRIKNCIKYDLPGGCRLVTIQDKNIVLFCFIGTHNQVDKWIDNNRGFTLATDKKILVNTSKSQDININSTRVSGNSSLSNGFLYEKIPEKYFNILTEKLKTLVIIELSKLESIHSESDIFKIVESISNEKISIALYDVFSLLRQNNIEEAVNRAKLFAGENKELEELTKEEIVNLINSDNIKDINTSDPSYFKIIQYYIENSSYMDWMLFLHPDQEEIVNIDYNGPSKLFGVSGSGKTCIVVKRAIRLAKKYPNEKILILTLNKSLAKLIHKMVIAASPQEYRENIEVNAFFQLCQKYLHKYEPNNDKLYNDITWKSEEHIDEIWSEFYRCKVNNSDAKILTHLHDSLISRKIDSEQYIREEFDWIRSAVTSHNRENYYSIERKGRSYPLDKKFRSELLKGLSLWKKKMTDIGVTDYLGISSALYKYIDEITPKFRCVLVDESQDFGTTELSLIRKLVKKQTNDLFFCGDAVQKISYKHQQFTKSDISIHASRINKIYKNYRNSKEILEFANSTLWNNITDDIIESEEFEFLDPEYADLSGSTPLVLESDNLSNEISSAYNLLLNQVDGNINKKGCIAVCGYTLFEIEEFAKKYNISVLNGTTEINDNNIFISDLEQTKGFEFDYVCIVNCNDDIIPNILKPKKEQIIDLSRLYVAMTRAKLELVISYSDSLSQYISDSDDYYLEDQWSSYINTDNFQEMDAPMKTENIQIKNGEAIKDIKNMTGHEFLYTKYAVGFSSSLIEKLRKTVTGTGKRLNNRPVTWRQMSDLSRDLDYYPTVRRIFGKDIEQLQEILNKHC